MHHDMAPCSLAYRNPEGIIAGGASYDDADVVTGKTGAATKCDGSYQPFVNLTTAVCTLL